MKIKDFQIIRVNAGPKGNWLMTVLTNEDGLKGYGEASQSGDEKQTYFLLKEKYLPKIVGIDPMREGNLFIQRARKRSLGQRIESFPENTAISAIEQAFWDLRAKEVNLPLYSLLGGAVREEVPLYANINRALIDRSSKSFARLAAQAVNEGFTGVKCAPFDGVSPYLERKVWREKVDLGIKRIAMVRRAIGTDVDLMVDCHGRFSVIDAIWLARKLEEFNLFWLEDSICPTEDLEGLRFLRKKVNIRLAGAERMKSIHDIKSILNNRLLDVIMPDVKHCGGVSALINIASLAKEYGICVAPHNPSGPISTAFSAHICSTIENLVWLEFPFKELSWRPKAVSPEEPVREGVYYLSENDGIGIVLNDNFLRQESLLL